MKLILNINGLGAEDLKILLPKINLIKDKIYPSLEVEDKNNEIHILQDIQDMDKALTLFKLLNNLNFNRQTDTGHIRFHCSLNEDNNNYGK